MKEKRAAKSRRSRPAARTGPTAPDEAVRDASDDGGFELRSWPMPCCGRHATLNELVYEWPQAFGRFALTAPDPGTELPVELFADLESTLGCKLRLVHQMY